MRFIDLTHIISNSMSTYPSDPDVLIVKEKNIERDNTLLHSIKMGTHTGTHLDAPAHIIPDGKTVDLFPLSKFAGTAIKVNKNSYKKLELASGDINGVLYDSGWYKNYNDPKTFYGPNRPIIPNELIDKLINMKINFFGCDLPSVDISGSKEKPIHNALLQIDIIIYESLTNFNQVPVLTPFEFFGFPLPFVGLDGSPVRAVGLVQ
jgi:arylformamidase